MMSRCDIFCRVIDNFGDIGVCWRLARQLASEHKLAVTLWVDDLVAFSRLTPVLDTTAHIQSLQHITVRHWSDDFPDDALPADLVIEGFGSALPQRYLERMAARPARPYWFNLEYLSAENWVEGCHALPSVHPATGLTQYFWFPSFTSKTGGLLREAALLAERDRFQQSTSEQAVFWARLGVSQASLYQRRLSLFAYENPCLASLLDFLSQDSTTTLLAIPEGRILAGVENWAGQSINVGTHLQRGGLTIATLPMLPHEDYDRLLWACDLNFVRGEDSFVRAQWAARPFLWHIYPQEEGAHFNKLDAFIRLFSQHTQPSPAWIESLRRWNQGAPSPLWADLLQELPGLQAATENWCSHLAKQSDLAAQLILFCQSRSSG